MADTSYLVKVVEPHLLAWASQIIGVPLQKRKVIAGQDSAGRPVRFEFDGVSDDGKIGVCISSSTSYKTGQMRKFFMEATLLNRIETFTRRIMVFIDAGIWEGFKNQCDGLVDLCRIEPMICEELPEDMRAEIEKVYRLSASEVGDKSGPGKRIPGRRSDAGN